MPRALNLKIPLQNSNSPQVNRGVSIELGNEKEKKSAYTQRNVEVERADNREVLREGLIVKIKNAEGILKEAEQIHATAVRECKQLAEDLKEERKRYCEMFERGLLASLKARLSGPIFGCRGVTLEGLDRYMEGCESKSKKAWKTCWLANLNLEEIRLQTCWVMDGLPPPPTPFQFAQENPQYFCGAENSRIIYVTLSQGERRTSLIQLMLSLKEWEDGKVLLEGKEVRRGRHYYVLDLFNVHTSASLPSRNEAVWWREVHCNGIRELGKVLVLLAPLERSKRRLGDSHPWDWRAILEIGYAASYCNNDSLISHGAILQKNGHLSFSVPHTMDFLRAELSVEGRWIDLLFYLSPPVHCVEGSPFLLQQATLPNDLRPALVLKNVDRIVKAWVGDVASRYMEAIESGRPRGAPPLPTLSFEQGRGPSGPRVEESFELQCPPLKQANCLQNLGFLYQGLGECEKALRLYDKALVIFRSVEQADERTVERITHLDCIIKRTRVSRSRPRIVAALRCLGKEWKQKQKQQAPVVLKC